MYTLFADPDGLEKVFGAAFCSAMKTLTKQPVSFKLETFLDLSAALPLTLAEERTLLDISMRELVRLRGDFSLADVVGGSKLERRLDYAIPILQRMLAAAAL